MPARHTTQHRPTGDAVALQVVKHIVLKSEAKIRPANL
jgi:hypothetical protein